MKVMAIGTLNAPLTPEQRAEIMPKEVPHTLKMYLEGQIEQFWFRKDTGPIFLMNTESVEEATSAVDGMPLVAGGYATYQFWPVGPLAPLALLLQGK
ncbi:hypothetical protein [Silvibacterium acidisoli]|uniref:hypothetical protein n=1 Tax=Acidobacteriaceae bacterium ZG23-2 TaxID=2883246 RepID=UPI00406CC30F